MVSQATLVATNLMCSAITVKALATLPRTVQTRSPHQEHQVTMTGHTPHPITTTNIGADPSHLTTDTAKNDTSVGQDHTTDPTAAEIPATMEGTHPTSHPTTTAAHNTHQLTHTLGDTLTGTHSMGTSVTHLRHSTFPSGITHDYSMDQS